MVCAFTLAVDFPQGAIETLQIGQPRTACDQSRACSGFGLRYLLGGCKVGGCHRRPIFNLMLLAIGVIDRTSTRAVYCSPPPGSGLGVFVLRPADD